MADTGTPAPLPVPAAPASVSPTPAPAATSVPASTPTPASPAPAAAPDGSTSTPPPPPTSAAASPTPAPAATPAPAPAAAITPAAPKLGDSLLGSATGAEAPAPAPAAADPNAPPAPAEPAPLPTYTDYKLPEGVQLEADAIGSFNKLLGEFETGAKADHASVEALGQKMVDFYIAEQTRIAEKNIADWTAMRDGWRDQFKADKDIGGARVEETLRLAGSVIERFGGTPEQQSELRSAFGMTGMGDHPAMIGFLRRIGATLREGQPVAAPPNSSRPPVSRSTRRYSSTLSPNGAN